MLKNRPTVQGYKEAAKYLGLSHQRFNALVVRYKIPYQKIACGRIFFKDDLTAFRISTPRQKNLKAYHQRLQKRSQRRASGKSKTA